MAIIAKLDNDNIIYMLYNLYVSLVSILLIIILMSICFYNYVLALKERHDKIKEEIIQLLLKVHGGLKSELTLSL